MTWNWNAAPGPSGSPRGGPSPKKILTSFLIGMLSVGVAWAGAVLVPVDLDAADPEHTTGPAHRRVDVERLDEMGTGQSAASLSHGQVLAGAAKVSIEPRPGDYKGKWETRRKKCATLRDDEKFLDGIREGAMHVADFRVRWAENPNCLYMGGYGIGPMNPITNWKDPYGLWVRSVAIGDGKDTLVLTVLDGVYYFGEYNSMCKACGFFDLQRSLGKDLGIKPEGFFFASTHSHTSVDFIGGWGGAPQWYMDQVTDSIERAVRRAVRSMRPANLETGEVIVRDRNQERRNFYRSAEEQNLAWFRALEVGGSQAIATVASYAAHPVTEDTESGTADADFPAVFSARAEEAFGGIGLLFQTGLGNMSPSGDKEEMGGGLAAALPPIGSGRRITNPDIRAAQTFWDQPVTNSGLTALGVPGFFDRPFNDTPAEVVAGKSETKPCVSASPVSVRTAVSAAKIGPLWITGAPGEIFSNYSNSLKERNPTGVTMPLALTNDGLGYIMQSFETDHAGRQVLGFVADPVVEYEDAYSIDACFGDMALETTIGLLDKL